MKTPTIQDLIEDLRKKREISPRLVLRYLTFLQNFGAAIHKESTTN